MRITMNPVCLLTGGLLLALVASCDMSAESDLERDREIMKQVEPEKRGTLQLPKLFDFNYYMRVFRKNYGSIATVASNRHLLFFSRAVSTFLSGMKYKFGLRDHYESVNHLSDRTREELDAMKNRNSDMGEPRNEEANSKKPSDFLPHKNESLEGMVREFAEEHVNEPGFPELLVALKAQDEQTTNRRNKRDTNSAGDELAQEQQQQQQQQQRRRRRRRQRRAPRELPQLINMPLVERSDKIPEEKVPSNNPYYEPIELPSYGLFNQQEVNYWGYNLDHEEVGSQLHASLNDFIDSFPDYVSDLVAHDSALPDVTFVDHRSSGCIQEPRSQGQCGSCYAFAGVTIMEWFFCKKKDGRKVAFSEQYIVDCGRKCLGNDQNACISGCAGGSLAGVFKFIHNYGMELRRHYPYTGLDGECPYEDDYDIKKTGYIRAELGNAALVELEKLESALRDQPLLINLYTHPDFPSYGGGIHDGSDCGYGADHHAVLIGHGRFQGNEYWIIRNSYSADWGENGYYRLAKLATKKCIFSQAIALGTVDGLNYDWDIKKTIKEQRDLRVG